MSDRRKCAHVIEGPNGSDVPGRPRPWWRRNCRRLAVVGSRYCWQHKPWYNEETQ